MRPRIVALAASFAAALALVVTACDPGTNATAPTLHEAVPSTSSASPTPAPDSAVNTITHEVTIQYPIVLKGDQLVCDPSVPSARLVPDANGYAAAFHELITLVPNPGLLRLEWGKVTGLAQALIYDGKKWAVVNQQGKGHIMHTATVMDFSEWGNDINPNNIVLCGWKK